MNILIHVFIFLFPAFFQKSPAVHKEIQQLKQVIGDQNQTIQDLMERVISLEKAANNSGVTENDETLGNDKAVDQEQADN